MMLSLIRIVEDLYCRTVFDYYGRIVKEYVDKMNVCFENEDYDNALYWENKIIDCLRKREKALDKRLWLRGYY